MPGAGLGQCSADAHLLLPVVVNNVTNYHCCVKRAIRDLHIVSLQESAAVSAVEMGDMVSSMAKSSTAQKHVKQTCVLWDS